MTVQGRLGSGLGKLVVFLLICGPLLNVHGILGALPTPFQLMLFASAGVYIIKRLLEFKRWNDELAHVRKFIAAFFLLLSVVIVENFCTWATSASDLYKYDYVPLQDNVEIALIWIFERFSLARMLILGWRVDMHWLLYSFVALCLSVMWDQVPYSGFGMAARFMDSIAWTHALRTVAFMITVLPNPRRGCYAANFPPVPKTLTEFIAIGFSAKRGSGCNDLVISGHGVVYAAVPLALRTFYPASKGIAGWTAWTAWTAVIKLCLQEVVDKTHYSVDMLLAVVCTSFVWKWRESAVYSSQATWIVRKPETARYGDPVPKGLIALVIGVLIFVFVGVYGV